MPDFRQKECVCISPYRKPLAVRHLGNSSSVFQEPSVEACCLEAMDLYGRYPRPASPLQDTRQNPYFLGCHPFIGFIKKPVRELQHSCAIYKNYDSPGLPKAGLTRHPLFIFTDICQALIPGVALPVRVSKITGVIPPGCLFQAHFPGLILFVLPLGWIPPCPDNGFLFGTGDCLYSCFLYWITAPTRSGIGNYGVLPPGHLFRSCCQPVIRFLSRYSNRNWLSNSLPSS